MIIYKQIKTHNKQKMIIKYVNYSGKLMKRITKVKKTVIKMKTKETNHKRKESNINILTIELLCCIL